MRRLERQMAAVGLALLSIPAPLLAQELPPRQEMWRTIQQQQREIDALRRGQVQTEKAVEQNKRGIDATADAVKTAGGSGEDGWWKRSSIGGPGEVPYNGGNPDEIALHPFVRFFGHRVNDRVTFLSELALEHAEDPAPLIATGSWAGQIAHAPKGHGGFGYDPVFFVPELGRTAAELEAAEKNRLSHRGAALRRLIELVKNR